MEGVIGKYSRYCALVGLLQSLRDSPLKEGALLGNGSNTSSGEASVNFRCTAVVFASLCDNVLSQGGEPLAVEGVTYILYPFSEGIVPVCCARRFPSPPILTPKNPEHLLFGGCSGFLYLCRRIRRTSSKFCGRGAENCISLPVVGWVRCRTAAWSS